jgi:undecaprenyl-diphosphatase
MEIIETIKQWDIDLFLYLNSFHNTFWDYCMSLFTTTQTWLLFYLTVLIYIFRKHHQKAFLIIIGLALIVTLADQGAGIFKEAFERLRPSHDPDIAPLAHNFLKKGGLYSFVSAHSANAFSFAVFSSLIFRNKLYSIFIFTWALLIAYTRVYLGVHFPADIICGGLLGALIGWLVFRIVIITERIAWAGNPIIKYPLSNREVSHIIISTIFTIIISFTAVNIFLKYGLIN